MPQIFRSAGRCIRPLAISVPMLLLDGLFAVEVRAAEIVVSWTEVQEEVRPRQGTRSVARTVRLSLRGGNVIADNVVTSGARGRSNTKSAEGRLGDSMTSGKSKVSWSVRDSKSLVRTQDYPQHRSVIRVTTQSDTACVATVSFSLRPGFQEYRLKRIADGEVMFFRSLSAENVSCRITP